MVATGPAPLVAGDASVLADGVYVGGGVLVVILIVVLLLMFMRRG